ncbi:hypothetical protein BVC80_1117g31 [Macleaya cordata]|uniref:Uncharacterized protein n=1 Tax=Macleaya cordata TaxID=56857 RepID=A0A200Q9A5_MACCD|nr:hypothetical protein BVC80_1117g31 [Macleaya cordata]
MLELYEQNRLPPSQSEVDGSAEAGVHRSMAEAPNANEESVPANGCASGEAASVKPGAAMPSSTRSMSEQSYADNQSGSQRSTQNQSNDNGSMEMRTPKSDHEVDGETKDHQHSEQEPLPCKRENVGETLNGPRLGLDQLVEEDHERNSGRQETMEAGEGEKDGAAYKSGTTGPGGRNLDYREGPVSQSPHDAIKKIDRDKVKAALEKRRKSRGDVARKMELMDEDDLIERELEDGIELAAEDAKIKRERRQSWTNLSNRQELKNQESGRENEDTKDGNHSTPKGQSSLGPEAKNVEEGEASLFDDGDQGFPSPKSSSLKRKTVSPDNQHSEGNQRSNYSSGYHHNRPDSMEDGNMIGRLGYVERDHKRQIQESQV